MRRFLLMVLGVALLACDRSPPAVEDGGADGRHDRPFTAIDLEREMARLAAESASGQGLWPGFDPLAVPLAVYDGERTFLFRHPSPPQGYMAVPEAGPVAHAGDGRHEAMVANTATELEGVPTATILIDRLPPDVGLTDLAAIAIHEAFHVYQRRHHPHWQANEADLFTYPTGETDLLALRRLETAALRQAVAADDLAVAGCHARQALALREERYAQMAPAFPAYERGTELNEGLAAYVEMRAAGGRAVELPAEGFGPTQVRQRAYLAGAALAQLLDRYAPDWRAALAADEDATLEAALADALGPGETCTFDAAILAEASARAEADVAALAAERAQRAAAFDAEPGWRVVVEAEGAGLLWPRGFDPLNVQPLDAQRTLHTRFLRLGNDAGQLEVMDATALTEGAGAHPLFAGVRRVTLTGLAQPQVRDEEGRVTVHTSGLTLAFDGASVEQEDGTVTVRLGP